MSKKIIIDQQCMKVWYSKCKLHFPFNLAGRNWVRLQLADQALWRELLFSTDTQSPQLFALWQCQSQAW